MRIFLTGASGFIGRQLVPMMGHHQLLLVGRSGISLKGENYKFIKNDLANLENWREQIEDFSPEACIHLAWSGLPDYSFSKCRENFNISLQLLDFLAQIGCKRIFLAGTCWEYGENHGQMSETFQPGAHNLFASFKTATRLIGEQLTKTTGINFIWGRIFFVYGPGQRSTSLIPSCFQAFKKGKIPELNNPNTVNDFIYVSDVARAILKLVENPSAKGIFNIGSGKPTKVGKICKIIAEELNLENLLTKETCLPEGQGLWADITSLHETIDWKPEISIEAGIRETIKSLE